LARVNFLGREEFCPGMGAGSPRGGLPGWESDKRLRVEMVFFEEPPEFAPIFAGGKCRVGHVAVMGCHQTAEVFSLEGVHADLLHGFER